MFARPPEETHYFTEYVDDPTPESLVPPPNEGEGVITTLKRTLSRRGTNKKNAPATPSKDDKHLVVPGESRRVPDIRIETGTQVLNKPVDAPTPPNTAVQPYPPMALDMNQIYARAAEVEQEQKKPERSGTLKRLFGTLRRKKEKKTPAVPVNDRDRRSSVDASEGLFSTLKRTLSRRGTNLQRSKSVPREVYLGVEYEPIQDDQTEQGPSYYDPLLISPPGPEAKSNLRSFRISEKQFNIFSNIMLLFLGTHNFHNYIPNASHEDSRCYMRIISVDTNAPFVQDGMEWIKVSFTAKNFQKHQIRKMVSVAVMVTRTNTPRSVVGNSFGIAKMDIPEFPPFGLFLSDASYASYDVSAHGAELNLVMYQEEIQTFKKSILAKMYAFEAEYLSVEPWIRSLDSYSFLYMYFLNSRGVIGKQNAFIRPDGPTKPEMHIRNGSSLTVVA